MATKIIGIDFGVREIRACEVFMSLSVVEPKATYAANVVLLEDELLVLRQENDKTQNFVGFL